MLSAVTIWNEEITMSTIIESCILARETSYAAWCEASRKLDKMNTVEYRQCLERKKQNAAYLVQKAAMELEVLAANDSWHKSLEALKRFNA